MEIQASSNTPSRTRGTMTDELDKLHHDTALRIVHMSDRGEISITGMLKVLRDYDEARQATLDAAHA